MQLKQVLANGKKGALNVGAVLILPELSKIETNRCDYSVLNFTGDDGFEQSAKNTEISRFRFSR
jgi:hypothetical protein